MNTTLEKQHLEKSSELKKGDKCDRCSSRAAFRVRISPADLFFCAHHAREHEQVLFKYPIYDKNGNKIKTQSDLIAF